MYSLGCETISLYRVHVTIATNDMFPDNGYLIVEWYVHCFDRNKTDSGLHFGMEDRAIISQCTHIFLHRASNCKSKHNSTSNKIWMIRNFKSTD